MDNKNMKHPTIPDPSGQEPKSTSVAIGHTAAEGTFITVSLPPGGWKPVRDAARTVAWTLFGAGGWAAWLISLAK